MTCVLVPWLAYSFPLWGYHESLLRGPFLLCICLGHLSLPWMCSFHFQGPACTSSEYTDIVICFISSPSTAACLWPLWPLWPSWPLLTSVTSLPTDEWTRGRCFESHWDFTPVTQAGPACICCMNRTLEACISHAVVSITYECNAGACEVSSRNKCSSMTSIWRQKLISKLSNLRTQRRKCNCRR